MAAAAGFLAGAAAVSGGLAYLRRQRAAATEERAKAFDAAAAKTLVRAPFLTSGPHGVVEHVGVPHLREYFSDLPTYDR
jgi:hypothetical protein